MPSSGVMSGRNVGCVNRPGTRSLQRVWRAPPQQGGGIESGSNQLVQKLWNFCNVLCDDGVSTIEYVEQLRFLLLKMAARPSTAYSVAQLVLGSNQPWPGNQPSTRPIGYMPQIQRWVNHSGDHHVHYRQSKSAPPAGTAASR